MLDFVSIYILKIFLEMVCARFSNVSSEILMAVAGVHSGFYIDLSIGGRGDLFSGLLHVSAKCTCCCFCSAFELGLAQVKNSAEGVMVTVEESIFGKSAPWDAFASFAYCH